MNPLERDILRFIAERSYPGQMRPTTTEIYRLFSYPAAKHALGMLQIMGHVGLLPHRRAKGVRRYEIRPAGVEALKRVAA